ncbi:MAG: hypothetical protein AAF206_12470 [Bacteroidota bacterium]
MTKPEIHQFIKKSILGGLFMLSLTIFVKAQSENEADDDLGRTFMPTIQMGYVNHGTSELSGGLMTQTSVEYRDISNVIFRINYDAFNSNMNLAYPIDSTVSFTGRTTFSELIIGVGYRQQFDKHNITAYIQPGLRFYGYPNFTATANQINLDYDSRSVGIMRYSIGYEYAIAPKLFFVIEGLLSHTVRSNDFWTDNRWSYGATVGISAPL